MKIDEKGNVLNWRGKPKKDCWFTLSWRGWRHSPLFTFGKATIHIKSGITFGKAYCESSVVYYVGHLMISIKKPFDPAFVEKVNRGTWPKGWLYVAKDGRFFNKKGKWVFKRRA